MQDPSWKLRFGSWLLRNPRVDFGTQNAQRCVTCSARIERLGLKICWWSWVSFLFNKCRAIRVSSRWIKNISNNLLWPYRCDVSQALNPCKILLQFFLSRLASSWSTQPCDKRALRFSLLSWHWSQKTWHPNHWQAELLSREKPFCHQYQSCFLPKPSKHCQKHELWFAWPSFECPQRSSVH